MPIRENTCACRTLPPHYTNYRSTFWGQDDTNGRFAEISRMECVHCGTIWLKYHVEFESYSYSGRWYCGEVTEEILQTLTPETVVAYLESLDEYFYGGSYFKTSGRIGSGTCFVDL